MKRIFILCAISPALGGLLLYALGCGCVKGGKKRWLFDVDFHGCPETHVNHLWEYLSLNLTKMFYLFIT